MRCSVPSRSYGAVLASLVTAALFCAPVFAATVVLNDGTVIQGDIESLRNDVYTVRTESLGDVRVRKDDISRIDYEGSAATDSVPTESAGGLNLQSLQQQLLQSQKIMTMIQALQSDPEIQAVMSDPEILAAISSGNYTALMNHPKILALTGNEKMREIIEAAQ